MQLQEETEEREDEYEECAHYFHEEPEPSDDIADQMVKMECAIGLITNLLEDEEEERENMLKQQARFNAERCPRCSRPHHKKAAKG